jgi:hypothetical protein
LDDQSRLNLSESLRSTAEDVAELARDVMTAKLDDPETANRLSAIAERCGDDCREADAILRNSIAARRVAALPPRRIPPDRPGAHRTPPDPHPGQPT